MGSRRKRPSDRIATGALNVVRVQRSGTGERKAIAPPMVGAGGGGDAAPEARAATTGPQRVVPRVSGPQTALPRTTGPQRAVTGPQRAVTGPQRPVEGRARPGNTGKHARVELVTRETDDGSYELVYEEVDDAETGPEESAVDAPPERRRTGLMVAAGVAVCVVLGLGAALAVVAMRGDGPKKVAATAEADDDGDEQAPEADDEDGSAKRGAGKKRYEYVPPKRTPAQLGALADEPDVDQDGRLEPARPANVVEDPAPSALNRRVPLPSAVGPAKRMPLPTGVLRPNARDLAIKPGLKRPLINNPALRKDLERTGEGGDNLDEQQPEVDENGVPLLDPEEELEEDDQGQGGADNGDAYRDDLEFNGDDNEPRRDDPDEEIIENSEGAGDEQPLD